jgi:hypothetical protein
MDGATWDSLLLPHEGRGLWFKPEAKRALKLDVGAVTVIKGRGVLKVGKVTEAGDHLVVEQGPVAFQDFIENGEIAIAGAMKFDAQFTDSPSDLEVRTPESSEPQPAPGDDAGAAQPSGNPTTGTKPASFLAPLGEGPLTPYVPGASKSLFDGAKELLLEGWHVEKQSVASGDDSLHYDITLTKNSGAFDAKIHIAGNVKGLGTKFKVTVRDHVTAQQTFDVKTSGDAELSWAVRISKGGTGYNKIVFPGLSYKQQLWVGEVPMVVKLKSSVGIILGGSGANTTTTGKVKLSYTSDGGVKISGKEGAGNGDADGNVAFEKEQGTLATGPAAFGFVATLPKVDIGVGLDGLFVTGAFYSNSMSSVVTARGAVALSPCANITTKVSGKVGLFVEVTDSAAGQIISTGAHLAKDLLSRTVYEKSREDVTCGLSQ